MVDQGEKSYVVEMKFSIKIFHFVWSTILGGVFISCMKDLYFLEGIVELIISFVGMMLLVDMFRLLFKSAIQIIVNPENKTIVKKRFLTKTYSYKCIKYILRSSFDIVKVYTDKGFLFQYDQSYTNYEKIDRMMKQKIQQKSIIEVKSKRELKKLMKEAKRRR